MSVLALRGRYEHTLPSYALVLPEQVRYRRDEETPRREVQAMAPASTAPQDSRLETNLQAELRATEARMAQAEDKL
eukprot:2592927-Rhodomonas_salina.1